MAFSVMKSGTWSALLSPKRRDGGAWVNVATIKRMIAGSWVQVWPLVIITDRSVTRSSAGNTDAAYTVKSAGSVTKREGVATTTLETWKQAGAASDYEIRATLISGDTPSIGTLATWQSLSADREWLLSASSSGEVLTCVLLIEVRLATSGNVEDSANVTITSTRI